MLPPNRVVITEKHLLLCLWCKDAQYYQSLSLNIFLAEYTIIMDTKENNERLPIFSSASLFFNTFKFTNHSSTLTCF